MSSPIVTNYKIISEEIIERFDANANAEPAYLMADDRTNFLEEISKVASDSVSLDTSSPSTTSTSAIDLESLAEYIGNYIVNDGEDIDTSGMETHSTEMDPPPPPPSDEPSETTPASGTSEVQEAVDADQDLIDDENFLVAHAGLSREQWDELVRTLHEMGYDDIANSLEAHPENAAELFNLLSDPVGFLNRLLALAGDMISDPAARCAIIKKIFEMLGYTGVGVYYDDYRDCYFVSYDGAAEYSNDSGGEYFKVYIRGDKIIIEGAWSYHGYSGTTGERYEYNLDDFDLSATDRALLRRNKNELRDALLNEKLTEWGLEGLDIRHISDDLKNLALEWQGRMWVRTDTESQYGWLYVDPRFFETIQRIQRLYNLLTSLFILEKAKQDIKKVVIELTTGHKIEEGMYSAVDAIDGQRQSNSAQLNYQFYVLTRYVNAENNKLYLSLQNKAHDDAYDEAHSNSWNWFIRIISCGMSDIMDHDTEARYEHKMEVIDRDRRDFEARVQAEYQAVFSEGINFNEGDPFSGQIDNIFGSGLNTDYTVDHYGINTWGPNGEYNNDEGLIINVGDSKCDINANAITGLDVQLTMLQNARRAWATLKEATAKLREETAKTCQERESGGADLHAVIMAAVDAAGRLERQAFSAIVGKIQSVVYYNNAMRDAIEKGQEAEALRTAASIAGFFGPLAPAADMLFEPIAIGLSSFMDDNINFQMTALNDEQFLNQFFELYRAARRSIPHDSLSTDQRACLALDDIDVRMWGLVGSLDDNPYEVDGNNLWHLNEDNINGLRGQISDLQNLGRALVMLVRTRHNLHALTRKITTGKGEMSELISSDILDNMGDSKRLAFEFKSQNIKNQVQEHNRQVLQEAALEKACWKMLGAFAGIVMAAISIVTFGVGAVAAIGVIAALATLGSSISSLIYNALHPVDASFGANTDLFAGSPEQLTQDLVTNTYRNLERSTEDRIDTLTRDTHTNQNDGQWGLDTKAFLEINSQVNRLQNVQKLLMMLVQTQQDIRNIVMASTMGVSAGDNSDLTQSSHRAAAQNRVQAIGLKQEMIADLIGAHNRLVTQDAEMERAWIQAGISAASIACGALLGGVGALGDSVSWSEGMVKYGMSIGGAINSIVNLVYSSIDVSLANGGLSNEDLIQEIIDDIYKVNRQSTIAGLEQQVNDTVSLARADLTVEVGGGNVAVNSEAFANLSNKLEQIFNAEIALASAIQAQGRLQKSVARIAGQATAAEDNSAVDTIYESRESTMRNLDILKQRVQEQVDLMNQLNVLKRQLTLAVVSVAMQAVSAYMKFGGGEEALAKFLNDNFNSESTTQSLTDWMGEGKLQDFTEQVFSGGSGIADGSIGLGDLAGMAVNVLLSDNFAQGVALQIYDSLAGAGSSSSSHSPTRVKGGKVSAENSDISYYESRSQEAESETGRLEVEAEKQEIVRKLAEELLKLLLGIGKDAWQGIGRVRQNVPADTTAPDEPTDLQAPPSETSPTPEGATASPETLLPAEYLQKYNELMAQQIGSPEAAVALLRQIVELNRQTFTAPEQQEAANAALLMAAQELSRKIDASNNQPMLQAMADLATSPAASPQERALALAVLADAAEHSPEAQQVFKNAVEEIAFQYAQGTLSQEDAKTIVTVAAEIPTARAILAEYLPIAAELAQAAAQGQEGGEPPRQITTVLRELKNNAALAAERSASGTPELGVVRNSFKQLVQILPQEQTGVNLQDVMQNYQNYGPAEMLGVLYQVRSAAESNPDLLTPSEVTLLNEAITSLEAIQTNAAPATLASNFLQKVRSQDPAVIADTLISDFMAGTEEQRTANLGKIRQTIFLNDGTIALDPALQPRLAEFLAFVANNSQNPQIKREAQALLEQLPSSTPQAEGASTESEAPQPNALPTVSLNDRQVGASQLSVLLHTTPERAQSTEHRTQSIVEGIPGTSDREVVLDSAVASMGAGTGREQDERQRREQQAQDDRPGFDPIFGGLGANQRVIEQHHQREDAAALA
jgi:hypothetical protein